MAEKRSKSILSGLKNMLHLDAEKPSKPAPKQAGSRRKKPAAAERSAPHDVSANTGASAEAAAAPATPDPAAAAKPDKKKVQNQPWYRHRQRW
ncbi:MAG TPA: hypothetical protein VMI74_08050 [Burkholderiales bacterium]|nr:hypothetical protein [Burkholderiales bacterium]